MGTILRRIRRPDREETAVAAIVAAFLLFWGGFNCLKLTTFNFTHAAQDQAIFLQILRSLTHRLDFSESIYRSRDFLGDQHFSPALALLAPLALVFPSAWLIAFFPLVPIAASGLVARAMAKRWTGGKAIPLLVLAASLFNPLALHLANQGIRETMLASLFLALAILCFFRERMVPFVLCCVLASLCKEDMPLLVAGFSLIALVQRRKIAWVVFPAAYGGLAFVAIESWIMPALGSTAGRGGAGFGGFSSMGASYYEVALHLATHPAELFRKFLDEPNRSFFRQALGPFWFLPLLAPEILLVPSSQFLEIATSSARHVADVRNWYHAPIYPFLVVAFARGLARVGALLAWLGARVESRFAPRFDRETRKQLDFRFLGLRWNLGLRVARETNAADPRAPRNALVAAILAIVLLVSLSRPLLGVASNPYTFQAFLVNRNPRPPAAVLSLYLHSVEYLAFFTRFAAEIREELARIPAEDSVCAQYPFLIFFAWRDRVSMFPDLDGEDWVVLHGTLERYPLEGDEAGYFSRIRDLAGMGYGLSVQKGGLLIFHRGEPAPAAPPDACAGDCRFYEAEYLPAQECAPGACGLHDDLNRMDRSASGLAARRPDGKRDRIVADWPLRLEHGVTRFTFAIKMREIRDREHDLMRIEVREPGSGKILASKRLGNADFVVDGAYADHGLAVENEGAQPMDVLVDFVDARRASYLVDSVRVETTPFPPPVSLSDGG